MSALVHENSVVDVQATSAVASLYVHTLLDQTTLRLEDLVLRSSQVGETPLVRHEDVLRKTR